MAMANKQTLWNAAMEARLVELLEEYRLVVEGDFGRPSEKAGLTKATKQAAWTTVAEKINSEYPSLSSTTQQLQKKLANMAYRVKTKLDKRKRVPTGGGPAPPKITEAEDALLALQENNPSYNGLVEVIDSFIVDHNSMSVTPLSPVTDTAALMPAHPGTVPPTHAPTASESGPTNWEESETYTSEEAVVPMKPSQKPSTSTTSGKPPCKRRRVVSREALNLECLEEEAKFFREGTEFFKESRELVNEVREKLSDDKCHVM